MSQITKYDLVFTAADRKEGFMIAADRGQDRKVVETSGPAELQVDVARSRDVPVIWKDLSQGMGFSESWGPGTNGYAYGQDVYTRSPRLILPSGYKFTITKTAFTTTTAPVTDSEYFDGKLRIVAGDRVLSLDPSETTVRVDAQFAGSQLHRLVQFRGSGARRLYVTNKLGRMLRRTAGGSVEGGSIGGYYQLPDPGQHPYHRFDDMVQVYWVVGDQRGYQLVGVATLDPNSNGNNGSYVYHVAANPETVTDWSPVGYVGSGYPVRSLAASNRKVYYCCDDGIYDLDEQGYSPNLTPYWGDYPHSDNGQWSTVYAGMVVASHKMGLDWVPVGRGARIDASMFAHPGSGLPNETPVYGAVNTGINDGGWLAISQFNGKDSYISYGKPRDMIGLDGPGAFVWHNEFFLKGEKVTHLAITTRFDGPMLIIFSHLYNDAPGAYNLLVREVTLPAASTPLQDWLNGGRMKFSERFVLYLPMEDWQDPASRKNLMRLDVQADGLGAVQSNSVQLELLAKADGQDWVSQGNATASPRSIVYPSGQFLDGHRIGMQVIGTGVTSKGASGEYTPGGSSYPPILRALKARAGIVVEQRRTRTYPIRLGSTFRDGGHDNRDHREMEDWLYSLQNHGPITVFDSRDKTERLVKVESGSTVVELEDPRSGRKVSIVELVCSLIEEQDQPEAIPLSIYTGPTWDSDGEWGDPNVSDPDDIEWQE